MTLLELWLELLLQKTLVLLLLLLLPKLLGLLAQQPFEFVLGLLLVLAVSLLLLPVAHRCQGLAWARPSTFL